MTNNFISSVWEFDNDVETKYFVHEIFRWYGKLPQFLVRRLIELYSKENEHVLADFCGSGTVLIEANLAKRNCVGIDSHPISLLINQVKIDSFFPEDDKFLNMIRNKKFADQIYFDFKDSGKWFYTKSLIHIQGILEEINKLKKERERNFYLLCLAKIIRDGSKIDSRCVNHIVVDNNKKEIDVIQSFSNSVVETREAIKEFSKRKTDRTMKVLEGDARKLDMFQDESFDLIISHPPYANAVLYYNIYSLVSTILGFDYTEIKENDISSSNFVNYLEDMKKVILENYRMLKPQKY